VAVVVVVVVSSEVVVVVVGDVVVVLDVVDVVVVDVVVVDVGVVKQEQALEMREEPQVAMGLGVFTVLWIAIISDKGNANGREGPGEVFTM